MKETGSIRHYFLESYTSGGIVSLLPELLRMEPITYLLTGKPGTGKSTILKLIGLSLIDRGYDVDYIRALREPDSVAGLFLPRYKIIFLDKQEFQREIAQPNEMLLHPVDFLCFCESKKFCPLQMQIEQLERRLEQIEEKILFACGEVPEEKEEVLLPGRRRWAGTAGEEKGKDDGGRILNRLKENELSFYFLHGVQPEGWLNLAPRFLRDFDLICLDKKEAASMMEEILRETEQLGHAIEFVLHPLNPNDIIGTVFPEKKLAIWKGNPCLLEEQDLEGPTWELSGLLEEYQKNRRLLKSLVQDTMQFQALEELRKRLLSSVLNEIREI